MFVIVGEKRRYLVGGINVFTAGEGENLYVESIKIVPEELAHRVIEMLGDSSEVTFYDEKWGQRGEPSGDLMMGKKPVKILTIDKRWNSLIKSI